MSDIRFNRWLHQSGTGGVYQDSSGRVGIGTSVPTSALDVQSGTIKIGSNTLSSTGVSTFSTLAATTITGVSTIGVTTIHSSVINIGTGTSINSPSSNTLSLGVNNTERIRINTTGVGIGTNIITRPFEVWAGTAGTSFSVDSSGRVRMPYQPHAEGGVTGLTNATPSSSTIITFNRADVNVGNHYDTSQYRFNCPITGNYLVKAHAQSAGQTATTSNTVNFNIRKNGASVSGVYESRYYGGTAPGYVKLEIIDVVYANAGDYLDIHAIISSTSLALEYASNDIRWRFSYTFLG